MKSENLSEFNLRIADVDAIISQYVIHFDRRKEIPLLVDASRSLLLFIDLQAKLTPAVHQAEACISRCHLLLIAARRLNIPILATEHCSAQIGPTVPRLRNLFHPSEIIEKCHFNGVSEASLRTSLTNHDRQTIVVAGMEAHICVLQTVLGLKANGYDPVVAADAIASRHAVSRKLAIRRMHHHGADIVNTEMVLFEWLKAADHPAFKDILALIKGEIID